MNANRPPQNHENILLTWQDNPEGDDRPYTKDGSIIRRHYSALMRDRFGSFGHMSVLVHGQPRIAEVEDFKVDDGYRNQGIGSMILRSALAHLKCQQYEELFSDEVGPAALYVRRSVLGENMQFYEERDDLGRMPIDKTFDEALRHAYAAERDRKVYTPLPEVRKAYGTILDIQSVDTNGWTLPLPYYHDAYIAQFADVEHL